MADHRHSIRKRTANHESSTRTGRPYHESSRRKETANCGLCTRTGMPYLESSTSRENESGIRRGGASGGPQNDGGGAQGRCAAARIVGRGPTATVDRLRRKPQKRNRDRHQWDPSINGRIRTGKHYGRRRKSKGDHHEGDRDVRLVPPQEGRRRTTHNGINRYHKRRRPRNDGEEGEVQKGAPRTRRKPGWTAATICTIPKSSPRNSRKVDRLGSWRRRRGIRHGILDRLEQRRTPVGHARKHPTNGTTRSTRARVPARREPQQKKCRGTPTRKLEDQRSGQGANRKTQEGTRAQDSKQDNERREGECQTTTARSNKFRLGYHANLPEYGKRAV